VVVGLGTVGKVAGAMAMVEQVAGVGGLQTVEQAVGTVPRVGAKGWKEGRVMQAEDLDRAEGWW
jgi:hypothetical protein